MSGKQTNITETQAQDAQDIQALTLVTPVASISTVGIFLLLDDLVYQRSAIYLATAYPKGQHGH